MTGNAALVSENMTEFEGDRAKLLEQAFPSNPNPARWIDWYRNRNVAILRSSGAGAALGVFNLGDAPAEVSLPARKADLKGTWHFRERWNGEEFIGSGDTLSFPPLPPHAGRIWGQV